jgi:hypothetical protein
MLAVLVAAELVLALTFATQASARQHHHKHPCHKGVPAWLCTKRLARNRYGWTGAQWQALNGIVENESGWNYCARYPSTTDCGYTGSNACGIPQADPCPYEWRGHLERWHRQVYWMLHYIRRNYGNPINAYAHEVNGGY